MASFSASIVFLVYIDDLCVITLVIAEPPAPPLEED